jgi:3-dehydrosphinganine reductase
MAKLLKNFSLEHMIVGITVAAVVVTTPIVSFLFILLQWKRSQTYTKPIRKRVLITGGSQGLGLALAIELVKRKSNIVIVGRNIEKLKRAVDELDLLKQQDQRIEYYSVDLQDYKKCEEMMVEIGRVDWIVCNAGSARTGFISNTNDHESQMTSNYMTTVNVCKAMMASIKKKNSNGRICGLDQDEIQLLPERIIVVGSICSMLSMIGFTAYCASKFALRGYVDGLRQELKVLGTKVHFYMPGNMDTPGFEQESKDKPAITHEIEGASTPCTPEQAAQSLLGGVMAERYYITNELLGELARISVNGGNPRPNLVAEVFVTPILALVFTLWSMGVDGDIKKHFYSKV